MGGILFFNPAISQCDFPENVDCHQNSVDQLIKLRDVDPTPSPTFKCPEEEGLYPNPTDCSKFYQCFNHVAWAGQCPANLYFNPSLKVCDFPEKVDCHHDFARLVYQAHQKNRLSNVQQPLEVTRFHLMLVWRTITCVSTIRLTHWYLMAVFIRMITLIIWIRLFF